MKLKKMLFINACISNNNPSRTKSLCDAYISQYLKNNKDVEIEEVLLRENAVLPFDGERVTLRNELIGRGDFEHPMFKEARKFKDADIIVIGAPYWDLSFPSLLKVYIENIMVTNLTFKYTESGSVGTCKAEKIVYITTSGGYIEGLNLGFDYIKAVGNMVGIKEAECISAQGLDIIGNDPAAIVKAAIDDII